MGIVEALVPLLLSLGKIIADYATASAEKRAQLIAQADADYARCRDTIMGLAAIVQADNEEAMAEAKKKPSGHAAAETVKP